LRVSRRSLILPEPVVYGESVGRSLGAALVAAGAVMSVLTLLVPLDSVSVSCILIAGALLVVLGFAMILGLLGTSTGQRPDVLAADYALREKSYPRNRR